MTSNIHIGTIEYRGMKYSIALCNPEADWGLEKGKFHITTELVFATGYYDSFEEATAKVNKSIDEWRDNNPKNINEWVDMIEACMIWTGYEDCDLDKKEVKKILERFKKSMVL